MRLVCAILLLFNLHLSGAPNSLALHEEIPFELRDGFLWIEVSIRDGGKPLNFLLDSGAQVSVLDSRIAQRLGLTGGAAVKVMGVGSSTAGVWPQEMSAWAGRIALPRDYLVLDLRNLSEACTRTPVDGIIGADFFHDRVVQLDYQRRVTRILADSSFRSGVQTLPLKIRRCGMLVPVRINNGKPQWVRLDTGCASALQWVTRSVRPQDCTSRVAVALTAFSVPCAKTTLTLGKAPFEGVPTDLLEKEIFPGEAGLLGNGILSRFQTVTIDARRKEVVFGPVLQANP